MPHKDEGKEDAEMRVNFSLFMRVVFKRIEKAYTKGHLPPIVLGPSEIVGLGCDYYGDKAKPILEAQIYVHRCDNGQYNATIPRDISGLIGQMNLRSIETGVDSLHWIPSKLEDVTAPPEVKWIEDNPVQRHTGKEDRKCISWESEGCTVEGEVSGDVAGRTTLMKVGFIIYIREHNDRFAWIYKTWAEASQIAIRAVTDAGNGFPPVPGIPE